MTSIDRRERATPIRELDIVRVVAPIAPGRVDHGVGLRAPRIGDLGAVVYVYESLPSREESYAVECVDAHGRTLWLADALGSELERIDPA